MRKTVVIPLLVVLGASDALVFLAVLYAATFGLFGPLGWGGIPAFAVGALAGAIGYQLFTITLPGLDRPLFLRAQELGGSIATWAGYVPKPRKTT